MGPVGDFLERLLRTCFFWMVKLQRLNFVVTLSETNSSHLPGCAIRYKRKKSPSNHPFSGALLVSERVTCFLTSGYFLLLI